MSPLKSGSKGTQALISGSLLFLFCVSAPWLAQRVRAQDDEAQAELTRGVELMRRHRYEDALKSFKHANDLRNRNCAECLFEMAQAYEGLAAYKNVVDSCDKAIELASADKELSVSIYNLKGKALIESAERKDQKKLQEAESALRKGIAIDASEAILHFNLGITLMQLNRDTDGVAELKKYVELDPHGDNAEEARKMMKIRAVRARPTRLTSPSRQRKVNTFRRTTCAARWSCLISGGRGVRPAASHCHRCEI